MATTTRDKADLERELESHRRELTGYCYRMLGSNFEAEDAVQDTMVKAWKGIDRLEDRAALRSWLYRIATNVCLDMVRGPQRRARPIDLGPPSHTTGPIAAPTDHREWIEPMADERILPLNGDPADVAAARDTVRLAFVAALQHLPARQRAVLILREVLRWQATEVAELLETTVASVNSALQRARATLAEAGDLESSGPNSVDADQAELLARYVAAFEAYDIDSLVACLADDVKFSMPPYPMWLQGPDEVAAWVLGPGIACKGSRMVWADSAANGCPAIASYRIDPAGGYSPWALHVLEISDGRITNWTNFLNTDLFAAFGLPDHLDA